jgi:hypothetical protein
MHFVWQFLKQLLCKLGIVVSLTRILNRSVTYLNHNCQNKLIIKINYMERSKPGSLLPASRCVEVGIECFNICLPVETDRFIKHD